MTVSNAAARGTVAPGFEPVREELEQFVARGWDIGSAFTAYVGGERVVHLRAGAREPAPGSRPYDDRAIQLVASASKFAESLGIALLVDRGRLRYDDRVAAHWPEFGGGDAAGKGSVTVRQLMMHRAGLPAFGRKLTDAELFDPEARARFLERQRQEPALFAPERGDWRDQEPPPQAYHAVSRGLYASELARRVDPAGRTLGELVRREIAAPLGLDFWIGLPESEDERVAPTFPDAAGFARALAPAPPDEADPRYQFFDYEREFLRRLLTDADSLQRRGLDCLAPDGVAPQAIANHRKTRACELPSSNGVGSAGALAALAALAANGGTLGGVRIFSGPDALRESMETAGRYAADAFMLTPVAFTQGGFARLPAWDDRGTATVGWGGAGGQMVRVVPELGIGCAYVTNRLGVRMAMNDPRANVLLARTIECARQVA